MLEILDKASESNTKLLASLDMFDIWIFVDQGKDALHWWNVVVTVVCNGLRLEIWVAVLPWLVVQPAVELKRWNTSIVHGRSMVYCLVGGSLYHDNGNMDP